MLGFRSILGLLRGLDSKIHSHPEGHIVYIKLIYETYENKPLSFSKYNKIIKLKYAKDI